MGKCNYGDGEDKEGQHRANASMSSHQGLFEILNDADRADDGVDESLFKFETLDLNRASIEDEEPVENDVDASVGEAKRSIEQDTAPNAGKVQPQCKSRTGDSNCSKVSSNWSVRSHYNTSRLRTLRGLVDKALAEHKIFSVVGCFPSIREALKQRGWLEKRTTGRRKKAAHHKKRMAQTTSPRQQNATSHHSKTRRSSNSTSSEDDTDEMLIARLLRQSPVDFYWNMRDAVTWSNLTKEQLVNRFPRAYFTTKVGLCNYMQQMHWYCEMGVSNILFPRCYNIGSTDELTAFKYDYNLTACLGLLKWLVNKYEVGGEKAVISVEGKVKRVFHYDSIGPIAGLIS